MTERLYYQDSYLHRFTARVVGRSGDGMTLYLDRTAFYPNSGGQPSDRGAVDGVQVVDIVDEGDRIAHRLANPVEAAEVTGVIDWARRFDHMQQHSGQHLLSAVFADLCGAPTVSFHLGAEVSTIDLDAAALSADQIQAVESRANEAVFACLPITVSYEQSSEALELRKASRREGTLRVISIEGLDRSACGGTHVRSTGEIGPILLRKLDKIRNTVRVEFLCGRRAVRRARADYMALARVARMFSVALDEAPAAVAGLLDSARAGEKQRRKLENELARYQGRELYDSTPPDAAGFRRVVRRAPAGSLDDFRGVAQSFSSGSRAVFVGAVDEPPALLLAVSGDSGLDAGKIMKSALASLAGRGGGNQRIAQGSVPSRDALDKLLAAVTAPQ